MNSLDKLVAHFERFPGIGSRQAKRFAHHLLTEPEASLRELSELILGIHSSVTECDRCARFFARNGGGSLCSICDNTSRDISKLMVVERDTDIQSIERSGIYDGYYFVLGGTVSLLDSEVTKKLRSGKLKTIFDTHKKEIKELILGFSVSPDGENTARFVSTLLKEMTDAEGTKVSELGRGLSTGSELEYADAETIKNALQNRH